jgi:NAD(P)-dependent dehydrogenase (short-subunit alcohol dehydrogenase family)
MADVLKGKVIIVTGAGPRRGRGNCKVGRQGRAPRSSSTTWAAARAAKGRTLGPAQQVVAEIKAAGGEAIANGANVASWDDAHDCSLAALKAFGDVDAIVNNAGILRDGIFHKMSEADWERRAAVNLKGCFNVARAAAGHFKEKQKGAFVHMTSTSGLIGNFGQVNYGAAKLGVAGLSKCIALDMAKFGVRSNCIAPFAWTRLVGTIPNHCRECGAHRGGQEA